MGVMDVEDLARCGDATSLMQLWQIAVCTTMHVAIGANMGKDEQSAIQGSA